MSELTNLVIKQNEESYQLGKKHGAIEELEKLKEEIECNMRKNNCDLYGYADSLVIIDKHIAELKGEQK